MMLEILIYDNDYHWYLWIEHTTSKNEVHGSRQSNQLRQPHCSSVDERNSKSRGRGLDNLFRDYIWTHERWIHTYKSLKFHLLFRKPILLFSSTTLRSHMIANSSPPATQYLQFDALRLNSYGWPNYPFTAAITGFVRYILVGPFKTIKTFEERKNYHWTLVHQNLCHLVRQVTRIIKFTELLENEKFMLMINMAGIELPLTSRSYPEQKLPPSPCKTAQCRSGSCSNSLFINVS